MLRTEQKVLPDARPLQKDLSFSGIGWNAYLQHFLIRYLSALSPMLPTDPRLTPETRHFSFDDYCNIVAGHNTNTVALMPGCML